MFKICIFLKNHNSLLLLQEPHLTTMIFETFWILILMIFLLYFCLIQTMIYNLIIAIQTHFFHLYSISSFLDENLIEYFILLTVLLKLCDCFLPKNSKTEYNFFITAYLFFILNWTLSYFPFLHFPLLFYEFLHNFC